MPLQVTNPSAFGVASGIGTNSGTTTTQGSQSGTGSNLNQYSPGQTGLQDQLMTFLRSMLPMMAAGTLTPNVSAMKTASADSINKNYSALGERMNRFLAARGFGKSGTAGNAALQTELGRQGDLAGNESKFAGLQLDQNNKTLANALAAAFQSMGNNSSFTNLLNSLVKSSGTQTANSTGFSTGNPGRIGGGQGFMGGGGYGGWDDWDYGDYGDYGGEE